MNQRIVRFDVRLDKGDYVDTRWDKEQRNTYLLRPDVDWPLSIDPLVWPSVFYSKIFLGTTHHNYGTIEVDPSVDDGDYWLNLEQMMEHYRRNKKPGSQGVPICTQLFSENPIDGDRIAYTIGGGIGCVMLLGDTVPREPPAGVEFLGFDVADATQLSALSNCNYTQGERQRLQSKWAERLNDFGLLSTYEHALEFKDVSNERVTEDAPFWIYGISRLMV
jgi:hypothetical protein